MSWIQFYETIYELDEVERPVDIIIQNDSRLDKWHKNWRSHIRKRLLIYHKDNPLVEQDMPSPKWVMGTKK